MKSIYMAMRQIRNLELASSCPSFFQCRAKGQFINPLVIIVIAFDNTDCINHLL